jgi:hypothetical protein
MTEQPSAPGVRKGKRCDRDERQQHCAADDRVRPPPPIQLGSSEQGARDGSRKGRCGVGAPRAEPTRSHLRASNPVASRNRSKPPGDETTRLLWSFRSPNFLCSNVCKRGKSGERGGRGGFAPGPGPSAPDGPGPLIGPVGPARRGGPRSCGVWGWGCEESEASCSIEQAHKTSKMRWLR